MTGQVLERRRADQKLVRQDSQSPQVDLVGMFAVLDHLGREVIERAAERVAPVRRRVDRPPEIR
jgi:hypothetical protein